MDLDIISFCILLVLFLIWNYRHLGLRPFGVTNRYADVIFILKIISHYLRYLNYIYELTNNKKIYRQSHTSLKLNNYGI